MAQYVFTMHRLGKVVPPKREILKNISLSFFPGAKIGVLGLNGSGKSTLLKIMAGVDTEFDGEARPMPDLNIGYLPQEPQLDPTKTVREVVEEAVSVIKDAQARLDEVYAAYADPDADFDKLAAEQAKLEAILQASDGHNLERQLEVAADALRLPAWDAKVEHLSGGEKRRVALCRLLLSAPDMLLLDEPTNHLDADSVAWLEHFLHDFPGTVVAITHDRYFLDNVAGWILELDRGGHSLRGQLLGLAGSQVRPSGPGIQAAVGPRKGHEGRTGVGAQRRQGPPVQIQGSSATLRRNAIAGIPEAQRNQRDLHPGRSAPGRQGHRVQERHQGLRRPRADRQPVVLHAKGAIVGVIGGNGAGKSTLFRMLMGKETAGLGHHRVGETVQLACVDQSREDLDGSKTVFQQISDGSDQIRIGNYEIPSRTYVGRFNFKGGDQQKFVKDLSGGERGRCTWP
jgi:ATPase subunit of ABC transporter with duplicated ATPase domains